MKSYDPTIFQLIPSSQLSEQHFQIHPVWSEYYDYDEREEIISWGINPTWLQDEMERVHHGNDHCAYPVLQPYPLPERMRLFVKATLQTPRGSKLDGYVVNDDAYAIEIFYKGDGFSFSEHPLLRDLAEAEHARLLQVLETKEASVFPLSYVTGFRGHDDKEIAGLFNPFKSED